MADITLPTIPFLRSINNDYLADVLYLFTMQHGQFIADIVISELNAAYDNYIHHHPNFTGTINVVGHSLGAIILYDILSHQDDGFQEELGVRYADLHFRPRRLFSLGSPVGAVLVMRGQTLEKRVLTGNARFYNIYHPYDPLVSKSRKMHLLWNFIANVGIQSVIT